MISEAEFFAGLTGRSDDLTRAVAALLKCSQPFCLIGGLAVNHYVEPVATLDADFAIAEHGGVSEALSTAGFAVEHFPHSINAQLPGSRLRIQITIDARYQSFPTRAVPGIIFGVPMPVASLEDLVQGKLWAATEHPQGKQARQGRSRPASNLRKPSTRPASDPSRPVPPHRPTPQPSLKPCRYNSNTSQAIQRRR